MADILAVLRADTAQFSAAMLDAKAETSGGGSRLDIIHEDGCPVRRKLGASLN